MATNKNFIVKNGLEVGGQEVVSSSGVVTSAALGGQTLSSTDSPTFANLTISNDLAVSGDLNLTGDLNITGDVNSLSVTDLDVTDQTITLGKGQVESASGGSGIVIDGSGASILWDETNDTFDINKGIDVTGTATMDGLVVEGNISSTQGGTAALPKFTLSGSTTTGLYTPATNSLAVTTAGVRRATFKADGNIEAYEDTGTTAKLFWDASTERLGIGTTSVGTKLNIRSDASDDGILLEKSDGTDIARLFHDGTSTNARFDMFSGGSATVQIKASGDTHFSGGNVGIGTSAPQNTLHIYGTGQTTANLAESGNQGGMLRITDANTGAGAGGAILFANYHADNNSSMGMAAIKGILNNGSTYTQGSLAFSTRNSINGTSMTERMRILYNGNVGIGQSNPETKLHVYGTNPVIRVSDDATTGFSTLELRQQNTATEGFEAMYNSTTGHTHLNNVYSGGDLIFATNTGSFGTTSTNERMRIGSDGNVGIGIANQSGVHLYVDGGANEHASVFRNDSASFAPIISDNQATSGTRYFMSFRLNNTEVGKITSTGSTTLYQTSSDYRLKENVDYTWDATTRLKQLKPVRFNWIADETNTLVDGFLAHEVSSIVPEAVEGEKDGEIDENGNGYQGIDQSKLIPLLTKALQEQQTIIDDLKSRLDEAGL